MELLTPTRRGFMGILGGALSFLAAPAIVRASSIMPVKAARPDWLVVPEENFFDLPLDVQEAIGGWSGQYRVGVNGFILVPNNSLVRRSFDQSIMRPPTDIIPAGVSQWHFPPRDGFDHLNGVDAPESWQ